MKGISPCEILRLLQTCNLQNQHRQGESRKISFMKTKASVTRNPLNRSPLLRVLLLILLVLAPMGGMLERSANAAFPGQNGKIAFHRIVGRYAIFTIKSGRLRTNHVDQRRI